MRRQHSFSIRGAPANGEVLERRGNHRFGPEKVAAVEHDTLAQQPDDPLEIGRTKRLPFRDDRQRIGAFDCVHG